VVARRVFAFEHRHEVKVAEFAVAQGSFAQDAFVDESEALIEMTGADVVFVYIEKETVRAEVPEGQADEFRENFAAEAAIGFGDDDALELDGAVVLLKSAEDGVGLHFAGGRRSDEVASVAAGEVGGVARLAPLADEVLRDREALDFEDARDVRRGGGAQEHRNSD